MKEIVFDHIIKVSKAFKQFLNFLKFLCGPPFASASDACGPPPFVLGQNFYIIKNMFFCVQSEEFHERNSF